MFSPAGVAALYAFPEAHASFGVATYNLVFRHKAPRELVIDRRNRPHDLFGNQELEGYLHPDALARVRRGDDASLERCAYESIRLAQRPLTLRQVLRPLELDDGHAKYALAPGVLIATMLSVTNPSAASGLDRFDPDRYEGRSPARSLAPARELVSTFGHGRHPCPAQRFSISAIRIAVSRLLERFELRPASARAAPRRRSSARSRAPSGPAPSTTGAPSSRPARAAR